jgi:hypothetical protein
MQPVILPATIPQPEPQLAPGAMPTTTPRRPSRPSPLLTSASSTPTRPALLNLKLTLPTDSSEADGHVAAPCSPSSRSKTKVPRSITEAGGQKRAIDGKDGPGSISTTPVKRQKQSTPGSPSSSTSSVKQLVRQSRPVTDLKKMAGLTPRGPGQASPPSSPRAVTTAQPEPRWRSTSHPVVPEGARLPSPSRPERSGSLNPDPFEKGPLPQRDKPNTPVIEKSDENQWDFTFSECDFGQTGELILAQNNHPTAENKLASSTAVLPLSPSLSPALSAQITAEILPKAKAQQFAAASYFAGLGRQAANSSDRIANVPTRTFRLDQEGLDTELMLVEMALALNSPDDVARCLKTVASRIAILKSGLPTLAEDKTDASANAGQLAFSASLDALEVACKGGVDLLANEQASRPADTSTANQPAQQNDPLITPSNQALLSELDALDALMDEKILPVTAKPVPTAPPKQ